MTQEPTVIGERHGPLGLITLNRPRAINALDLDMIRQLQVLIDDYDADDEITSIALRGAGDRGLCAGGDMVTARAAVLSGDPEPYRFFLEEYTLNARIARCATPVIAFMDGLVLGGGIGLAGHARHRLVTESSKVGMPEVTIGFVPDVGGTWLLSRAPGDTGMLAALSGEHLGWNDAIYMGLADRLTTKDGFDTLIDQISSGVAASDAVNAATVASFDEAPLSLARSWVDTCFGAPDVASVLARLERDDHAEAHRLAEVIATKSPSSLVLTHALITRARHLADLESALALEYSVVLEVLMSHDLIEGVRAALVDKDRSPRWNPHTLSAVPADLVARAFERYEREPGFAETFRATR